MTTLINKLFGKNKEEATMPLDPHTARYMFDLLHFAKWVMKREPLTPDEPMSFNPFYQQ